MSAVDQKSPFDYQEFSKENPEFKRQRGITIVANMVMRDFALIGVGAFLFVPFKRTWMNAVGTALCFSIAFHSTIKVCASTLQYEDRCSVSFEPLPMRFVAFGPRIVDGPDGTRKLQSAGYEFESTK